MKNHHLNYLHMCIRVKKFYRRNEQILDTNLEIPNLIRTLIKLIDNLEEHFESSISYTNGYSYERARKREELQFYCMQFTEHLKKVQTNIKYKPHKLLSNFDFFDQVKLNILEEEELIVYASDLYDLSNSLESRLKTIGIYQKSIERFSGILTLYALDLPMNRVSTEGRKISNTLTIKILEDLDDFYSNKLDPAVASFEKSHPIIFDQYKVARQILAYNLGRDEDYNGTLVNMDLISIANIPYNRDREIVLTVEGGNAIWGLSKYPNTINYSRPVKENEVLALKSRVVGPSGDYLMIQSVNPENKIQYKVWLSDV